MAASYTVPSRSKAVSPDASASPDTNPASPANVYISPANTGLWHVTQPESVAGKVTSLLMDDFKTDDAFFNDAGFHNHITHHLLSLYGTGAPSACLDEAYIRNKGYQRKAKPPHNPVGIPGSPESNTDTNNLAHPDWYENHADKFLGRQPNYPDFLAFFQADIARKSSWESAVLQRLFSGTPAADDLLVRLHAAFLHPLIQFMFGVEWNQPAIIAQGLANAAVHRPSGVDRFLPETEKLAKEEKEKRERTAPNSGHGTTEVEHILGRKAPSFLSLFREVAADHELQSSLKKNEDKKSRDGVSTRAPDPMKAIAAKVHVEPTEKDVAERTAEMAETCVFVAAAAAKAQPRKHVKFDFFLIHHVNSIPFYLAINEFDWMPTEAKARLLEWKVRADLMQYASRECPPLNLDGIQNYRCPSTVAVSSQTQPLPSGISGDAVDAAARLFHLDDDGHAIKLIRATGVAQRAVEPYRDAPWRILRSNELWSKVYHMEVDSVLGPGAEYVRSAGSKEAWRHIPDDPNYGAHF